ncbi:hypothetical protein OG369_43265 [Streptomyces sp. NBC_01221]|uniref:hypothetical protein n=1 Tax=Streptomyces sp. NBC_01221 TaxID=2903782 RepID=UPI00225A3909|nr:hypothetical protein [Streptomyces sp. NBC_01221]MCX4792599.1 hypothetical protein [Streptomyces sp. NBC_01221]
MLTNKLTPRTDSPWLGKTVRGPYRRRSTVQRVYATPFGVNVALCHHPIHQASILDTLRLEATDMLSTPNQPAAQCTAYLRNHRDLLRLHGRLSDSKATARTQRAIKSRTAFWLRYRRAKVYVEAALLESVQAGDRVVDSLGVQMTVTDPDSRRDTLWNWRTEMKVQLIPQHARFANNWRPADSEITWPIEHEGWGLLPTLNLI